MQKTKTNHFPSWLRNTWQTYMPHSHSGKGNATKETGHIGRDWVVFTVRLEDTDNARKKLQSLTTDQHWKWRRTLWYISWFQGRYRWCWCWSVYSGRPRALKAMPREEQRTKELMNFVVSRDLLSTHPWESSFCCCCCLVIVKTEQNIHRLSLSFVVPPIYKQAGVEEEQQQQSKHVFNSNQSASVQYTTHSLPLHQVPLFCYYFCCWMAARGRAPAEW